MPFRRLLKRLFINLKRTFQKCIAYFSTSSRVIFYHPHRQCFIYQGKKLVLPKNSYQTQVAHLIWSDTARIWDSYTLVSNLFEPARADNRSPYDETDYKRLYDAIRWLNIRAQKKLGTPLIVSRGKAWQAYTKHPSDLYT